MLSCTVRLLCVLCCSISCVCLLRLSRAPVSCVCSARLARLAHITPLHSFQYVNSSQCVNPSKHPHAILCYCCPVLSCVVRLSRASVLFVSCVFCAVLSPASVSCVCLVRLSRAFVLLVSFILPPEQFDPFDLFDPFLIFECLIHITP